MARASLALHDEGPHLHVVAYEHRVAVEKDDALEPAAHTHRHRMAGFVVERRQGQTAGRSKPLFIRAIRLAQVRHAAPSIDEECLAIRGIDGQALLLDQDAHIHGTKRKSVAPLAPPAVSRIDVERQLRANEPIGAARSKSFRAALCSQGACEAVAGGLGDERDEVEHGALAHRVGPDQHGEPALGERQVHVAKHAKPLGVDAPKPQIEVTGRRDQAVGRIRAVLEAVGGSQGGLEIAEPSRLLATAHFEVVLAAWPEVEVQVAGERLDLGGVPRVGPPDGRPEAFPRDGRSSRRVALLQCLQDSVEDKQRTARGGIRHVGETQGGRPEGPRLLRTKQVGFLERPELLLRGPCLEPQRLAGDGHGSVAELLPGLLQYLQILGVQLAIGT